MCAVALLAGGCGSKTSAPARPATRHVSWLVFRQAILDCRVSYVEQDHNRYVVAKLGDRTEIWSTAPRTDDIFGPVARARCKPHPIVAEE